jgi:predicted aspartyl protease
MLVDTGATMSLIPGRILRELGIRVRREMEFSLADESRKAFPIGEALIGVNGDENIIPVVFGPDDVTPLLGGVALEVFGLAVDPVNRRLVHVGGLLK